MLNIIHDMKIAICWIGIGKYNCLFDDFYKSFNEKFCIECERTFFIFTDQPNSYRDIPDALVYDISNACTNKEFILFRKFKYLLMAEDKYLNYNVVVGINGNSYIQKQIHLNDIYIPNKITCIDHPLKKGKFENGLIGNPLTQQYYIAKNWQYKQVGLFILDSKMFLRMSQQIEVWRMIDKLNGVSHYVLFHDEGYFNKYCIKNKDKLNIIDSSLYMCPQYLECSKDATIITRQKEWIFDWKKPSMNDLYEL